MEATIEQLTRDMFQAVNEILYEIQFPKIPSSTADGVYGGIRSVDGKLVHN